MPSNSGGACLAITFETTAPKSPACDTTREIPMAPPPTITMSNSVFIKFLPEKYQARGKKRGVDAAASLQQREATDTELATEDVEHRRQVNLRILRDEVGDAVACQLLHFRGIMRIEPADIGDRAVAGHGQRVVAGTLRVAIGQMEAGAVGGTAPSSAAWDGRHRPEA
jgi:hypothetical protein